MIVTQIVGEITTDALADDSGVQIKDKPHNMYAVVHGIQMTQLRLQVKFR
jgi:hypothetical protein